MNQARQAEIKNLTEIKFAVIIRIADEADEIQFFLCLCSF